MIRLSERVERLWSLRYPIVVLCSLAVFSVLAVQFYAQNIGAKKHNNPFGDGTFFQSNGTGSFNHLAPKVSNDRWLSDPFREPSWEWHWKKILSDLKGVGR